MSLSSSARIANDQHEAAKALAKQEALDKTATEVAPLLADLLGVTVTHWDSRSGHHPEELRDTRRGFESKYVSRTYHEIHRFMVDDIVCWWLQPCRDSNERLSGRFQVERPCRSCGKPHGVDLEGSAFRGYEALARANDKAYASHRTEAKKAARLKAIGAALDAHPLCWDCQIGVPYACPTCGRHNETNG